MKKFTFILLILPFLANTQSDSLNLSSNTKNSDHGLFVFKAGITGGINGVSLIGDHHELGFSDEELLNSAEKNGVTSNYFTSPLPANLQNLETVTYKMGYGFSLAYLLPTSNPKLHAGPFLSYNRMNFEKKSYSVFSYFDNVDSVDVTPEFSYKYSGYNSFVNIGAELRYDIFESGSSSVYVDGRIGLAFSQYKYGWEKTEFDSLTYATDKNEFKGQHFAFPIQLGVGYSFGRYGINLGVSSYFVPSREKKFVVTPFDKDGNFRGEDFLGELFVPTEKRYFASLQYTARITFLLAKVK